MVCGESRVDEEDSVTSFLILAEDEEEGVTGLHGTDSGYTTLGCHFDIEESLHKTRGGLFEERFTGHVGVGVGDTSFERFFLRLDSILASGQSGHAELQVHKWFSQNGFHGSAYSHTLADVGL